MVIVGHFSNKDILLIIFFKLIKHDRQQIDENDRIENKIVFRDPPEKILSKLLTKHRPLRHRNSCLKFFLHS